MEILPYRYAPSRVCTRCLIHDTVKGITFDENGECTFFKIHDELELKHPINVDNPKSLKNS